MTDNKYCRLISECELSEQMRSSIKQSLRKTQKKNIKESITVVSASAVKARRIKTFTLVAATIVLVLGVSWILSSFIHVFSVDSPIPKEESEYMAGVAQNAQYLPNENILAASESATSLNNYLGEEDDIVYDDFYQKIYETKQGELNFYLDDYRTLNDSLAIVSHSALSSETTIYDIKREIEMAIGVIPGYDQWFRLPDSLPHLSQDEEYRYLYNYYRINYDKTTDKITVERRRGTAIAESYDSNNDKLYDDAYMREYFKVEYYHDEQGREVVDCTVISYLIVDNVYHPITAQRLINVKDHSLTKYAANYMRSYDVAVPANFKNITEMYDLTQIFDYGIDTLIIQLNYNSSDDITLLKSYYETADKHYGLATTGELSYYKKTLEDTTYFTAGWDNREDGYDAPIHVFNEARVSDNANLTHKNIVDSFAQVRSIKYNRLCDECEADKPSDDGVFIDCKHGVLLSQVNRTQNQIFSDSRDILCDATPVFDGIEAQYANFAATLGIDTQFNINRGEEHFFETSVNDYIVNFGKEYFSKKVQTSGYSEIDEYVEKNKTYMDEDNVVEYIKDEYSFTYDVKNDTVMTGLTVDYNTSVKVNIADVDPEAEYYLAVILENCYDPDDFAVLNRTPVNFAEDGRTSITGQVTVERLIGETLRLSSSYSAGTEYKLAFVVIEISKDVINPVTYSRTIKVDNLNLLDFINDTMYYDYKGLSIPYAVSPCYGGISIRIK